MRAWTLGVSVVFHFSVISGVVVAPLFATGELPEPPRAAPEYLRVTASLPPEPPALRRPDTPVAPSPAAAPLTPQAEILPETPAVTAPAPGPSPIDVGEPAGDSAGNGFVPGSVVSGNQLPEPPVSSAARKEPVRVGGEIRAPQRISGAAPRYPSIAQASRVQGVVILEAVIGEDGAVQNVRVLRSMPLLDAAAVEAVRQWRFTPTLLNGQPVPIVMTVTVSFTLNN
jgi:protein TonB